MKSLLKFTLRLGLLAVIAAVVVKVLQDRESPTPLSKVEPPHPPQPHPEAQAVSWVEPQGTVCPTSHPIKGKLSSKVFRTPSTPGYDTSKPDRCYASADEALRDGLREAKR